MLPPRTIVFIGGGTGGHLQPGVVLREALLERHPDWQLPFLLAGRPVERSFVSPDATGLELFPGRSSRPAPWRADLWAGAWLAAARFLNRVRPDLLVFLGGYVAFVARLARLRTPMVLLESNVLPGRSARLAAPFARRLFLQWMPPEGALPMHRARVTGMPLRFESLLPRREARKRLGLRPDSRVLAVMGGSLGAAGVNDRLVAGAADLAELRGTQVLHVTGARDEERVAHAYAVAGVDAVVLPFCDDMAAAYAAADLVVGRAGGMTVAELAAAGRPALFLPYPHHADRHQEWNARVLVDAGAAWMVREDEAPASEFVRRHLLRKLADPDDLELRGRKAHALGRRDGTRKIVAEIEELLALQAPVGGAAMSLA
jgi:UDP-N-acetylglucosamine--N-acetylmuramyl-(pentapeptide) pyrophosphoryl-undecaprenol N-acetylglucosamine transferase